MFFTYLTRELRRRSRQAFVIALGLALGIGLTITVNAASAGVKAAQNTVLHSLYGVGTDMTSERSAAAAMRRWRVSAACAARVVTWRFAVVVAIGVLPGPLTFDRQTRSRQSAVDSKSLTHSQQAVSL